VSQRLMTKKQVAELLSVCPTTVERLVHRYGVLPAYRVGGDLRFRQADIEQYLSRCRIARDESAGSEAGGDSRD